MPGDWKRGPKEDILGLEDPPPPLPDVYIINAPNPRLTEAGRRRVEELLPFRKYMSDEDSRAEVIDDYLEEKKKEKKVVIKTEKKESLSSKTKALSLGLKAVDRAVEDAQKMDIDPKDNDW